MQLRKAPSGSGAPEIRFLEHMIQHQKALGDLLLLTSTRQLSPRTKAIIEHSERHRLDTEADLVAARQGYGSGRLALLPPAIETGDSIEQFRGAEYERRLVDKLIGHYKGEVAEIDASLPQLNAENVRSLAKRIRDQRLHDIRELTQRAPK